MSIPNSIVRGLSVLGDKVLFMSLCGGFMVLEWLFVGLGTPYMLGTRCTYLVHAGTRLVHAVHVSYTLVHVDSIVEWFRGTSGTL